MIRDDEAISKHDRYIHKFLREKYKVNISTYRTQEYAKIPLVERLLVFHVYPINKLILDEFQTCIKEKFGISTIGNIALLTEILRDRAKRLSLTECYKMIYPDLNFTSLSLAIVFIPLRKTFEKCLLEALLTGDTRLDRERIQRAFFKRYSSIFDQLSSSSFTFQVPHHGSRRGFDLNTAKKFKKQNLRPISIISCSLLPNYRYKFPDLRVIQWLKEISPSTLICNEKNLINIRIYDSKFNTTVAILPHYLKI